MDPWVPYTEEPSNLQKPKTDQIKKKQQKQKNKTKLGNHLLLFLIDETIQKVIYHLESVSFRMAATGILSPPTEAKTWCAGSSNTSSMH